MTRLSEYVIDLTCLEKVQVIEKNNLWGFTTYKVYNPVSKKVYKLSEEQIGTYEDAKKYDENYIKYISLLAKIQNEASHGILTNLGNGIIPLPHQMYALSRAVSNNNVRYILADEVGLGKTIEAGLIIKELQARGLIKRILVVCPTGLVTQWQIEMQEKFGLHFNVILPSEFTTIKKITQNDDVYSQFDYVISPMDSIKPLERRAGWTAEKIEQYNEDRIYSIINSGWDLIIIDEAHRVAGSSSDVARHKLGSMLSKSSPYILLLTATPHSGKTEPFLRLVRLLDEKAFPNYKAIVKEQVAPYLIRTEKREAIDNDGNPLFKKRSTKIIEVTWDEKHSIQKELYEQVTKYVREGYNRAIKQKKYYIGFLMVLMQRLVTSSTAAIKDSIERRIAILNSNKTNINQLSISDLADSEIENNVEDALALTSMDIDYELSELNEMLSLAKQAEYQYMDAKVEMLSNLLEKIFDGYSQKKLIIFTEFVATQAFLVKYLKQRGFKTSVLNGSLNIEERNVVLKEFKLESDILIATDAGGEGLNLQFSSTVINYDLPWNPMKIEQRIGRVDRIGQVNDVTVYNFIITDTIENRVRNVLESKLQVILSETGLNKISDVLDTELSEVDFTQTYINTIRNPKNIDYITSKLENNLESQLKSVSSFKSIIEDKKDLEKSHIEDSGFNLDNALREMMNNYCLWEKNEVLPITDLSINDEEIIKHLSQEIFWNKDDVIPVIDIADYPNEEGYFSLWSLSINDNKKYSEIIPVFINSDMVFRPLSGKRIWDVLINNSKTIKVTDYINATDKEYETISDKVEELAYEVFINMKDNYEKEIKSNYERYNYAIKLRLEAANRIGIPNIKNRRINDLNDEKQEIFIDYKKNMKICPVLKPLFFIRLEK